MLLNDNNLVHRGGGELLLGCLKQTTDSSILDWHQFSILLLSKLKNGLELNKMGELTNLPGQTIREKIPCFSMTITLYIEEEVNYS